MNADRDHSERPVEPRTLGGCMWCNEDGCDHGARLADARTTQSAPDIASDIAEHGASVAFRRAARQPTGFVDIDHWLDHDGGPELDGPVLLTDEPSGDAMRWTGGDHA